LVNLRPPLNVVDFEPPNHAILAGVFGKLYVMRERVPQIVMRARVGDSDFNFSPINARTVGEFGHQ
jgi:hypothetical protein